MLQGSLYQETAKYSEAEAFLKRGLVVIEENLGRNHLSVSRHLERLAQLYQRLGRYGEAESLLWQYEERSRQRSSVIPYFSRIFVS